MSKRFSNEERYNVVNRVISGESVSIIASNSRIDRSTIYQWIKEYRLTEARPKNNNYQLQKKNERLERVVQILQNAPCTASSPLHE